MALPGPKVMVKLFTHPTHFPSSCHNKIFGQPLLVSTQKQPDPEPVEELQCNPTGFPAWSHLRTLCHRELYSSSWCRSRNPNEAGAIGPNSNCFLSSNSICLAHHINIPMWALYKLFEIEQIMHTSSREGKRPWVKSMSFIHGKELCNFLMHLALSMIALRPFTELGSLQEFPSDIINTQQEFRNGMLRQPNNRMLIIQPPLPLAGEYFNRNPQGCIRGWYDREKCASFWGTALKGSRSSFS